MLLFDEPGGALALLSASSALNIFWEIFPTPDSIPFLNADLLSNRRLSLCFFAL
ncbi:hypothetical protein [Pseudomonas corrugata]|uniref:hypothetical protein n=1 Tax=Pseudomonas corrugata TaxID=47879 RepID=UPI00158660D8|nr:hypothetical protein [Pseudomonas corrugata]MCI0997261.1 hypothetical protein [Pseudomonas corrugata]NUT64643.1 hypothetical protein [Pseudomonas corrugata]